MTIVPLLPEPATPQSVEAVELPLDLLPLPDEEDDVDCDLRDEATAAAMATMAATIKIAGTPQKSHLRLLGLAGTHPRGL